MLPALFDNIQYYLIGDDYSYAGDLVVSSRVIWFFPHTDLEAQRNQTGWWSFLAGTWAIIPIVAVRQIISEFKTNRSQHLVRQKLWRPGITAADFQQRAAAYLEERRNNRTLDRFSDSLPAPVRYTANEVSYLKITPRLRLTFVAGADNQDFQFRRKQVQSLREALAEAGFL